ncbi:MAG TPA: HAD family hydrolase [Thermohalobaculum sp.]|nr:HAD family hydrolase [Thermohalobaculum sp.]
MTGTVRIAMWSGPRNISTAMMRAWGSRADTQVTDEPFYACYLAATGLEHPMREAVLAARPTDWEAVARACAADTDKPVHFQKHMAQHMLPEAPLWWMAACRHAFLIRPPGAVAASFRERWAGMRAEDLGFRRQAELFEHVSELTGTPPPVIEADDVLRAPRAALGALCAALGVGFDPAMLRWAPGPRPSDGVWGAHWYRRLHRTTGFAPPRPAGPVPPELDGIVAACLPFYERLRAHRLAV